MNEYRFQEKPVVIIEGKIYNIDLYNKQVAKSFEILAQQSNELSQSKADINHQDVCKICYRFIETVLGKGCYEEIFKERSVDLFEHLELAMFICNQVEEFKEKRLDFLSNSIREANNGF